MPQPTDLVTDLPADFEVFGQAVATSMADLLGGTTGQILSKATNTDMDFVWTDMNPGDITGVTAGTGISGGGTSGTVTITNSMATEITAKGDLIVGTGSATFDNLAAGANGSTLVADSSTSTGLRYQAPVNANPILNSAFQIWQRGTTYSGSVGGVPYTADRWCVYSGADNRTISRQATGDTTNLPFIQYCARIARNSGITTTNAIDFSQSIETLNSIPYAGKTVTVSFYARAGANYSAASSYLDSRLYSGTGTDQNNLNAGFTGSSLLITQNNVLTTTWQRFSMTVAVGATATELEIRFRFTPTGTAGANDYYEVTGVQLEVGSVATPFKTNGATIQGELSACERYFQIVTGQMCSGANTTTVYGGVNFRTQMRTAPSVALSAAMTITDAGADYTQSAASVSILSSRANSTGAQIQMPNFTGTTAHRPYTSTITASQIQFSAEL